MSTHKVIEIPLEDLARDPVLPPRIMDEERLDALCRSMAESGLAEPLVVRRAPDAAAGGPKLFIVLGYRRFIGAGRMSWDTVPAVVRDDLDDPGVLQLAFDADKTAESRTPLENCWYYASMCAAGVTQAALAEREGFSEGKASMYVRTGNTLTPERIAAAGVAPEDLAGLGIVKLAAIASGPEDQVPARLLTAVGPSATEEEHVPGFEWKAGRQGSARATFRTTEVTAWSSEERVQFIDSVGPLLAQARLVEGVEDAAVVEVRSSLEEAHRIALIEAREDRTEQILRLLELNTKLLLALNGRRENLPQAPRTGENDSPFLLRLLRSPLQRALGWLGSASRIEHRSSMIEDQKWERDTQIPIQFGGEYAA